MAMLFKKLMVLFVQVPIFLFRNLTEEGWDGLLQNLDKYVEHARYMTLHTQAQLRETHLAELFGPAIEKIAIPFGAIDEETGKPNQAELLYVSVVAKHLQARNIFEFGTYMGRTTYHLTDASEEAFVTTLDLPPEAGSRTTPYLGNCFKGTERERKIKQILCDSKTFDTTPFRKKMDFIFVDGDHSYEGVKNDTEKAFEMLAPGGIIMWHDYGASSDLGLVEFFVEFTKKTSLFRIKKTSLLLYVDGVEALTFQGHKMRPNPKHASKQ